MKFFKLGTQGKLPRVIEWYIYRHVEAQSDEFLCDFLSAVFVYCKVKYFCPFYSICIDFGSISGCVHFEIKL